ncbi:MAG: cyclic nucleotide-binding domain-containing protein, partial [Burkholderiaceae bacterium]
MDIKASVLQRVSEWERAALEDECRHCAIRSSALFAELTDEDFERIHRPIDRIRLAPGAVIFNDGDAAEALFTVRRGAVKIEHVLPDGRSRITAMHHAGDLIGLSGYAARRHDARAVALTEVELCRLPVSLLRELEACSPRLQAGL